jgi:putative transposase
MDTDENRGDTAATYCFTVALLEDRYGALTEHIDTLRLAFRAARDRYPFEMKAGVILPDHLHCILTMTAASGRRSARWRLIKGLFGRVIEGGREIWKPDFEEHRVADDAELTLRIDRVHADPVRHGLVRLARDWPYSSFHAYVASGLRPMYWSDDAGSRDALPFARRAA